MSTAAQVCDAYPDDSQCQNQASFKCDRCSSFWCDEHNKQVHADEDFKDHSPIKLSDTKAFEIQKEFLVNGSPSHSKKDQRLFYMIKNPDQSYELVFRPWTIPPTSNNNQIHIVSFVGGSGAGKSTLMGPLCDGERPTRGRNDDQTRFTGTSSDIAYYPSTCNGLKFITLDTEGFNGTDTTTDQAGQDVGVSNAVKSLPYKRLVYLFSDVLVYVHKSSLRDVHEISKQLLEYANQSALNSTNNPFKPHLILVLNCNSVVDGSATDEEHEIFKSMKSDFEQIKKIFQSQSVISVPGFNSNPSRYANQVQALHKKIEEKLREKHVQRSQRDIFEEHNVQSLMQAAVDTFNLGLKQSKDIDVDLFKLILSVRGTKNEEFIYEYFVSHFEQLLKEIGQNTGPEKSKFIQEETVKAFELSLQLTQKSTLHKATYENAKKLIKELAPCQAQYKDPTSQKVYYCNLISKYHSGDHKSLESKKEAAKEVPVIWSDKESLKPTASQACKETTEIDGKTYSCCLFASHGSYHISSEKREVVDDQTKTKKLEAVLWGENFKNQLNNSIKVNNQKIHRVCVGCIEEIPTELRECNHFLCTKCAQDEKCPVINMKGDKCEDNRPFISRNIPQGSGYRILCIDDCDLPANYNIVQHLNQNSDSPLPVQEKLNKLEALLRSEFDLPIVSFFDLVVANGVGGIIALNLIREKDTSDKNTAKDLEEYFSKSLLIESRHPTHVSVTATHITSTGGSSGGSVEKIGIFSTHNGVSYNSKLADQSQSSNLFTQATTLEAAKATYCRKQSDITLPNYLNMMNGHKFKCNSENLIEIAHLEGKRIFRKNAPNDQDIIVYIGDKVKSCPQSLPEKVIFFDEGNSLLFERNQALILSSSFYLKSLRHENFSITGDINFRLPGITQNHLRSNLQSSFAFEIQLVDSNHQKEYLALVKLNPQIPSYSFTISNIFSRPTYIAIFCEMFKSKNIISRNSLDAYNFL